MTKEDLVYWLKQQQPNLENILLKAAEEFVAHSSARTYFAHDARKSGKELWLPGQGKDLCYDRPTIGFNYSLWFHPKRINTFLEYFTDVIFESRNEATITIFDLGAGTGAVLWAVGLVVHGLKYLKIECPNIRIINIDTSPFMIAYSRDYLWRHFLAVYPLSKDIVLENDYQLNSWSNVDSLDASNVWICASYLFDHSENAEAIRDDFKALIEKHKPNKILLLSSAKKQPFVDAVTDAVKQFGFSSPTGNWSSPVFSGHLTALTDFRNRISSKLDLGLMGIIDWKIDSLYGRVLYNNTPQLIGNVNELSIFSGPQKDRSKIKLTKQQEQAATLSPRPCLIVGPAGCGKSVVLTQKIKNIVDLRGYDPSLRILITSFNRSLVEHLGDWIEQLLDQKRITRITPTNQYGYKREISYFKFTGSSINNICVLNFDVLPTILGNIKGLTAYEGTDYEEFHRKWMVVAIEEYLSKNSVQKEGLGKILDPDFLIDEYQRIIYGLECNTEKAYNTVERLGRGANPQLRFSSERRKITWGIIKLYLQTLKKNNFESFTVRRHRLIKKLRAFTFPSKFDYILVDEFQDCTQADYEIFYRMLKDTNNITFAGDLAQSLSLGTSLHYPMRSEESNMQKFESRRLIGSFRLPMRISECIRPFSQLVSAKFKERLGVQADIISPYKGSPPGARPLLIYAADTASASDKISSIFNAYASHLKLKGVTIYERDIELNQGLVEKAIPSSTEIILRTKGLEKDCVIWSTRTDIGAKGEIEEFVYTILTRTVSLLAIVIFPSIRDRYIEIVKTFVAERLLFWDAESETQFNAIINGQPLKADDEDIDNSAEYTLVLEDDLEAEIQ